MKRNVIKSLSALGVATLVTLVSSCSTDNSRALSLLAQVRSETEAGRFENARYLMDSLRNTYPEEIEVRRELLKYQDTLEIRNAEYDFHVSDSVATFRKYELEDLKEAFVLEKIEKYQTVGYYVPERYAGSKSGFTFFPEVDETGKFLLVKISRNQGIKYDFLVINPMESDEFEITPEVRGFLPRSLTQEEMDATNMCHKLARAFAAYEYAKESAEKFRLKIRFFEKKAQKR